MEMPYQLEVLWCRAFQSVLKIGNYVMGYRMPKYLEGPGKIKELGAFLKEKGINDVLVVTGAGMVRRGQVQPMLDGFAQNGIRYTLQTYSTTDPTSDDVELGCKTYKENGCKSIVALGGLYGVAHGLAMAVLLPHVMKEFGASAHKRLADVCGISGRNDAEKANAFIRWIEETNAKMGLPDKFDVVQDKDIDQMITWAKKEANPLYPVPVVWARKDFRRLIESIRK